MGLIVLLFALELGKWKTLNAVLVSAYTLGSCDLTSVGEYLGVSDLGRGDYFRNNVCWEVAVEMERTNDTEREKSAVNRATPPRSLKKGGK